MKKHDFDQCAAVDHHYWTLMVVWCPHRQAFVVARSAYLETGILDEPADYQRQTIDLGPFDGPDELLQLVVSWINEYRSQWGAVAETPLPPGSPG